MPGVSNSAILLILIRSIHCCHPFCVTTDFYDWQGHVTVSCKEPVPQNEVARKRLETSCYSDAAAFFGAKL